MTASSFHGFCTTAVSQAGLAPVPPPRDGSRRYFESVLPDALLNALSEDDDLRFDAVVVDEAQDFLDNWWPPLLLALKEDDGVFYVFKDDNQKIYGSSAGRIPGLPDNPLHLSVNFRNTKSIFSAAARYYEGGELVSGGPEGKDIEWAAIRPVGACRGVEKLINRLTNIDGIPQRDIAVLCACNIEKSSIYRDGRIGRYRTRTANELAGDTVIFDSLHRFKGLESRVVILTDLDAAMDSAELLYVGLSRARLLLIVAAPDSTMEVLKKRLSPGNRSGGG